MNKLNGGGVKAKRVPLSGAMTNYPHDIILEWLGGEAEFEAKHRADGFKEIYKWIKPARGLFIRADRQEGLAVIRLADFITLLNMANQGYAMILANPTGNGYHVPGDWLTELSRAA